MTGETISSGESRYRALFIRSLPEPSRKPIRKIRGIKKTGTRCIRIFAIFIITSSHRHINFFPMKQFACSIILFFSLLSGNTLTAQGQKGLFQGEIGLQTYTFRNSFPRGVEATLDTIKSLGFTELEANPPKGVSHEDFRKMCDARGLKIVATGAGYEELVKDPMQVVKNARILGSSFVMVAWIPHKAPFKLDDAMRAAEDFNKGGKVLKENGITLCYHNHGYEFIPHGAGTLFDYIVENTNPEYVSFELDVLWAIHPGADPVELLKKYGSRFKLMHLKDLKKV